MSMDFRKTTYRPNRTDNRFRTSYALMSQWMNRKGSGNAYRKEPLSASFAIAMQGNSAFPTRNPAFSAGSAREMSRSMDALPVTDIPDPMVYNVTAQSAAIDENVPVHLRFNETAGYDDSHKAFNQFSKHWPSKSYPEFGPPRLRHGRAGGSWRHVKEVLQAGGSRIVFVDGVLRWADGAKIDEIPAGHLINPRVGDIKSRYISPRDTKPSAASQPQPEPESEGQYRPQTSSMTQPGLVRSRTDMPPMAEMAPYKDFIAVGRQKSGL